jgi:prevent-host-death family protein
MSAPRIRISEDFVPVSEFKAQIAELLKGIGETERPLIITQHGKPAGVVLSPASYDAMMSKITFMAGLDQGLADIDAGRVHSHKDVMANARKRFPRRKR